MIAIQNKAAPKILAYIENHPWASTVSLSTNLGLGRTTVEYNVNMLHRKGLIHIAKYVKPNARYGSFTRLFKAGPGKDARKPRLTPANRKAMIQRSERKIRKREQIRRMTVKYGPFAIINT